MVWVSQWWRRPRTWFYALLTVLIVVTAGWVWFLTSEGREKADQWSSIAGPGLAAVALVVPVLVWLWRQGEPVPAADDVVPAAVRGLVQAQYEQWTVEQAARQVGDPYPLPVRWQVSDRAKAVMASWAAVRGRPGGGPVPLQGSFDMIAAVFTAEQSPRRLVVLGEPGAGKSVLVLRLTVDLLTAAREKIRQGQDLLDPVPVMVSIGGWDPQQPFPEWIAERLAADNPSLRRMVTGPDGTQRALATELVATGRVLPVLDGLDEITDAQHPAALAGIEAMAGQVRQFVLTCRTRPYENAVRDHGPVAGTPVVEIQPLATGEVGRYLMEGTDGGPDRFARVAEYLRTQANSPVALALTTPLYAWLARVVYRHHRTRPAELLDADWAGTRDGIQEHLLDGLIPAVFATATGGHRPYTPAQTTAAHQHLAFLADHLHRHDTYDLAWWQLHQALTNRQLGLAAGLVFGLAAGLAAGLAGGLMFGLFFGLAAGLLVGLMVGLMVGPLLGSRPENALRKVQIDARRLAGRLAAGLMGGLATGLAAGLAGELMAGLPSAHRVMLPFGLVFGFATGLATGLVHDAADEGERAISPPILLREDRAATLVSGLVSGLRTGLAFVLAGGFLVGLTEGTAVAVGAAVPVVVGVTVVLMVGNGGAWQRFLLTRAELAMQGRTPWRLMTFLQEAHDRGILRQAGGFYQFRHARLQDRLVLTRQN